MQGGLGLTAGVSTNTIICKVNQFHGTSPAALCGPIFSRRTAFLGQCSKLRYSRPALSVHRAIEKNDSGSIKASQQPPQTPAAYVGDNGTGATTLEYILETATKRNESSLDEDRVQSVETWIERKIFDCRFFTLMAVIGSLAGSFLCFSKGCLFVIEAFREYFHSCWAGFGTGKVILLLVEAVDVYLVGTVMLIFGMGLYELFVNALEVPGDVCLTDNGFKGRAVCGSNFFGLFRLRERPRWLEIHSLDELKTKLGHVIVMILLVGMFEKSKKVPINTANDLLCFSLSILLASGCLFLLSKLQYSQSPNQRSQG